MKVEIEVINKGENDLPKFETSGSAGMDVRSNLKQPLIIKPNSRHLIPTGLFVGIPVGYEIQIRPRSGLALKHGVTVLNTPGTIDSDYRGEIGVILMNLGDNDFVVSNGDRIAQMVFKKTYQFEWVEVDSLDETSRKGGFGSTGI